MQGRISPSKRNKHVLQVNVYVEPNQNPQDDPTCHYSVREADPVPFDQRGYRQPRKQPNEDRQHAIPGLESLEHDEIQEIRQFLRKVKRQNDNGRPDLAKQEEDRMVDQLRKSQHPSRTTRNQPPYQDQVEKMNLGYQPGYPLDRSNGSQRRPVDRLSVSHPNMNTVPEDSFDDSLENQKRNRPYRNGDEPYKGRKLSDRSKSRSRGSYNPDDYGQQAFDTVGNQDPDNYSPGVKKYSQPYDRDDPHDRYNRDPRPQNYDRDPKNNEDTQEDSGRSRGPQRNISQSHIPQGSREDDHLFVNSRPHNIRNDEDSRSAADDLDPKDNFSFSEIDNDREEPRNKPREEWEHYPHNGGGSSELQYPYDPNEDGPLSSNRGQPNIKSTYGNEPAHQEEHQQRGYYQPNRSNQDPSDYADESGFNPLHQSQRSNLADPSNYEEPRRFDPENSGRNSNHPETLDYQDYDDKGPQQPQSNKRTPRRKGLSESMAPDNQFQRTVKKHPDSNQGRTRTFGGGRPDSQRSGRDEKSPDSERSKRVQKRPMPQGADQNQKYDDMMVADYIKDYEEFKNSYNPQRSLTPAKKYDPEALEALIEERDALKSLVDKMVKLQDSANKPQNSQPRKPGKNPSDRYKEGRVPAKRSWIKESPKKNQPSSKRQRGLYMNSPTRKSPFDVDSKNRKTEWENSEPYLAFHNDSPHKSKGRGKSQKQITPKITDNSSRKTMTDKKPLPPQRYRARDYVKPQTNKRLYLPDESFCAFCDDYMHPECYEKAFSPRK